MKFARNLLTGLILATCAVTALAADDRVYSEGPVVDVSYIRTKPGHFDDYMEFLATTYRQLMEANKKAGLILDYNIYMAYPRTPQDPDLVLTIVYPNFAAYDRTAEFDAVAERTIGSMDAQNKASMDREGIREVLGSEVLRKLVLK